MTTTTTTTTKHNKPSFWENALNFDFTDTIIPHIWTNFRAVHCAPVHMIFGVMSHDLARMPPVAIPLLQGLKQVVWSRWMLPVGRRRTRDRCFLQGCIHHHHHHRRRRRRRKGSPVLSDTSQCSCYSSA